jgi:hypothetical protein
MSIKIAVLRSGDQIITDVSEMVTGPDNDKLVGYYFFKPCVIKLNERKVPILNGEQVKTYDMKMHPWIPLTEDERVSIPIDHVTTFVEPVAKAYKMYADNVVGEGWEDGRSDGDLTEEQIEELAEDGQIVEESAPSD